MAPKGYRIALIRAFRRYSQKLDRKSRAIVAGLPLFMNRAMPLWIVVWLALASLRLFSMQTPPVNLLDWSSAFLPYAIIALSPVIGFRLAKAAFPEGENRWTLQFRLAVFGSWKNVDRRTARRHKLFGPTGFMTSLLVGLLLNVVVRSAEFLLAVPAVTMFGPDWAKTIFLAMAFEVIAMNFLYMVCFVMALHTIPLFPRMLLLTWLLDMVIQLSTASMVAAREELPHDVAFALIDLLQGNITKVLISVLIWLPYLLLSERVNITYRSRVAA